MIQLPKEGDFWYYVLFPNVYIISKIKKDGYCELLNSNFEYVNNQYGLNLFQNSEIWIKLSYDEIIRLPKEIYNYNKYNKKNKIKLK